MICKFNTFVNCSAEKCDKCGHNPAVAQERAQKKRDELSTFACVDAIIAQLMIANWFYPTDRSIAIRAVQKIKPAKVQPVIESEWIDIDEEFEQGFYSHRCKECRNPVEGMTRFCPNCGAKMFKDEPKPDLLKPVYGEDFNA